MSSRDEFEAAIDDQPELIDNYLVFGDWLQEQQDPRGELIGLCRATGIDRTEDAKARIAALQRQIGPATPRNGNQEWFYGFVKSMRAIVDEDDPGELRTRLDHPTLRHLTKLELELAGREHDDRQWLIDLIAERPRVPWRHLHLYSYWRGGNDPPAGDLDLTPLWRALPRISVVYAGARFISPGALDSTRLTELELDGQVDVALLAPLFAGSAPNLKVLSLHDVDVDRFANAVDDAAVTLPLTRLELPHTFDPVKQRILARYPCATFQLPFDGDRYQRTDE